ncbi:ATP-binding cassette domain-containing protein [Alkalibacter rhizosphaerae]|uniref:ATP-binding cassette domain-containing protein n=1 Tax=Alkalibacter rhizosphaerae TaxID=2815577 RepID=A0A974XGU5_9FIRM|nr:ABC transporter ATP-binding protein [Alkalibacter rhizosphaerae]QSX09441.1 ATP-binding cassette domain-containing protein [Alkalibacter rhizosphaerae]
MFELKHVTYRNILDIPELRLEKGKITSILGESGSGKTTLLRLLNKMISCNSGEIRYDDQPLQNIPSIELRSNVVMLPQQPVIFSGTVRDNLLIGLKFARKDLVDDDTLGQILQMVHLNKGLEEDGDKLSGGEKQRLALGRVILLDPEVYLLDEPSSALDEETEKIIIEELVAHSRKNHKTLIMVTHSRGIAEKYSDAIVRIHDGKIVEREDVD